MPRPALTDEQRKAIRRNIREAAARLYNDEGLANISVRAIAKQAGVSVGTVYSHFGSLSELLQSLWRQPARRLIQEMAQLAANTPAPQQRLTSLLGAYVQFAEDQPDVFRSAFLFVRPKAVEAPQQIALEADTFFQLFCETIASGQQAGVFRDGDPQMLTQLVLSAVHGALALPINLHRLALQPASQVAEHAITAQLAWLTAT